MYILDIHTSNHIECTVYIQYLSVYMIYCVLVHLVVFFELCSCLRVKMNMITVEDMGK